MEIIINNKRYNIHTLEVKENGESIVYCNNRILIRFGDFDRAVRFEENIVKALKKCNSIIFEVQFINNVGWTEYVILLNNTILTSCMNKNSAHNKLDRIMLGMRLDKIDWENPVK